jgi:hypothetical protein
MQNMLNSLGVGSRAAAPAAEQPMARTSSQQHSGGGNKHTIDRLLDDLCLPGILERRVREAERPLIDYLDNEVRGWPAELQAKAVRELYVRLERRAMEK